MEGEGRRMERHARGVFRGRDGVYRIYRADGTRIACADIHQEHDSTETIAHMQAWLDAVDPQPVTAR